MSIRNSRLRDAPRRGWRVRVLPVAAHPLALAFALMLVMISPVVADAKPLTDIQDTGNDTRVYMVSVENEGGLDVNSKFSAACWMCGINPSKLDSDMRSKLSNSGSGGRFYDFAMQFEENHMVLATALAAGIDNTAFLGKITIWGLSWGFWRTGVLDKSLYSGAMIDLSKVMRGESIGGGSSISGDDLTFTLPVRYVKGTNAGNELKFTGVDGKRYTSRVKLSGDDYLPHYDGILPNVLVVNLHDVTFWNGTTQLSPSDTGITSGAIRVRTPGMTSTNLSIVLGNGEVTPVSTDNTVYNGYYYSALNFAVPFGDLRYFKHGKNNWSSEITVSNASSGLRYEYSNGVLDVYFDDSVKLELNTATSSQNLSPPSSYFTVESQFGIFGSQTTGPPSNNWPGDGDDDPTPGPPDVPNPPVIDPPDPRDPIIPNPPVYDPDPTGTDYVPYLVRIIHCLQDINTSIYYAVINLENALSEHCLHIRTMMAQCLGDLCDYMYELCHWLAEQLSFDVSAPEYDDSTVVSWLMRIYDRISGLNFKYPSYRPTRRDVDNGFDWWGWLLQTIADIFGENFEAGIEGYMQLLRGVLDKFPFSVPWDFLAVYGLLVAVPATPVFDITIPAVNGWWSAITYHIDLHPFDHVAGAVRHMVMLLWVVVLIRRTKWMTGIFESGALVVSDFLHNRG